MLIIAGYHNGLKIHGEPIPPSTSAEIVKVSI
jgi:hypothetical protein